jgi:protein TonB
VPLPPKPPKGTDDPGASKLVPLPPADPVTPPVATPDRLPEAPSAGEDAPDDTGTGTRGVPEGVDHGDPFGTGIGPTGGGLDDGSPQPLSGDMERPVLLSKVEPVYPNSARIARMTGRVVVEAVIGLEGGVESAEVIFSTSPLFDAAALDAVRHWKYKPALMNGRPVRVYFKVAVEFVIR